MFASHACEDRNRRRPHAADLGRRFGDQSALSFFMR
jgi:hypothetical protein